MSELASPLTALRSEYDVVVVGSGYGASVLAARLARAGQRVCVLERGREWPAGSFPRAGSAMAGLVRVDGARSSLGPRDGLVQLQVDDDLSIVSGSGVGGGSLINSGVFLRPDRRVMTDACWPRALRDELDGALDDDFRRAEAMLRPRPYPTDRSAPKAAALEASARAIGLPTLRPPITVAFEDGPNAAGVTQTACTGCGQCTTGCNVGAKTTLGVTYLADAIHHGAQLFARAEVDRVERAGDGWRVLFHPVDAERDRFDGPPLWVRARRVVLGAGVVGTVGVLLRSRSAGLSVSQRLGERVSSNGAFTGVAWDGARDVRLVGGDSPSRDPVGASVMVVADRRATADLEDGFVIEDAAVPSWLGDVLRFGWAALSAADRARRSVTGELRIPVHGASLARSLERSALYLVMSHEGSRGRLDLEDGRLRVRYPTLAEHRSLPAIERTLTRLADAHGGHYLPFPAANRITVHPLGGAAMGDDASCGVVDHRGRVFSGAAGTDVHDGLYVVDGSTIPRSLGANPIFTITALAERAARYLVTEIDATAAQARETPRPDRAPELRFTERMSGWLTRADDVSPDAPRSRVSFVLTIAVDDVEAIATDAQPPSRVFGTVDAPDLSPSPLVIEGGTFVAFTSNRAHVDTYEMVYDLPLVADDGRRFRLRGVKALHGKGPIEAWRDTRVMEVTLDAEGGASWRGRMEIRTTDLLRQAATMTSPAARGPVESALAIGRFAWRFSHGLLRSHGGDLGPSFRWSDARIEAPRRLGAPRAITVTAGDGAPLRLLAYAGGGRGPVLLLHGYSSSERLYTLESVRPNLVEALRDEGWDVYVGGWRAHGELSKGGPPFDLDLVARHDHPALLDAVRRDSGASRAHVVALCVGSLTMLMSAFGGHLDGRLASLACLQVGAHWDGPWLTQAKVHARVADVLDAVGVRAIDTGARTDDGLGMRLVDLALLAHPFRRSQRCSNPSCRRSALIYGELLEHENVDATTHEAMGWMLGYSDVSGGRHLAAIARKGHAIDAEGRDVYLPNIARLDCPVAFFHGDRNQVVGPRSTRRTHELLVARGHARSSWTSIPGYGHLDMVIGRDAGRDVFPRIVAHLDGVSA
jgi:cholesterol oxidase